MSTQMARKAVKRATAVRKIREKGLQGISHVRLVAIRATDLRRKWGSKVVAGTSKKAGKVMRLKMPTTAMKPSRDEARMPERFCNLR